MENGSNGSAVDYLGTVRYFKLVPSPKLECDTEIDRFISTSPYAQGAVIVACKDKHPDYPCFKFII